MAGAEAGDRRRARARPGHAETPAKILLENGTRYAHEGKLQFADVTVDPTHGQFPAARHRAESGAVLLPGMYVRAMLGEGQLPQGLLAPQQGITRDPKGNASALVVDTRGQGRGRAPCRCRARSAINGWSMTVWPPATG